MNIISPKTMWFIILLVAICSFFLFDHEYLFIPHIVSKLVFIVCTIYWFTVVCLAFFVNREAYKNSYATSGVVTKGIYKKMRHPMYVGDVFLFIGLSFLFPMFWVWITAGISIIVFVWFMHIENGVIEERFGSPKKDNIEEGEKNIKKTARKTKKLLPAKTKRAGETKKKTRVPKKKNEATEA